MSFNSWQQTLITQQAVGVAVTNTTAATSVLLGQAKFTMPAGLLQFIGQKLKVKASGRLSTAASAPGTLNLGINFGSINVYTQGATGTLATSASNLTWKWDADLVLYTVGSGTAATLYGSSTLTSFGLSASTPIYVGPVSSPAPGTGFDSTVASVVDFLATWSVASASNSIRCDDYELMLAN